MLGSDRSWGSDWCGEAMENRRGGAFIADGREAGELSDELKEPVFESSVVYRIHHGDREVREASHEEDEKVAGHGVRVADDRKRKKDANDISEEPLADNDNEDVDAVWHRGVPPRNF
ncbi:MAG: hypothetical protein NTAFB09_08290 [Nitrosospira sp.]